jgi:hypothetical protein
LDIRLIQLQELFVTAAFLRAVTTCGMLSGVPHLFCDVQNNPISAGCTPSAVNNQKSPATMLALEMLIEAVAGR